MIEKIDKDKNSIDMFSCKLKADNQTHARETKVHAVRRLCVVTRAMEREKRDVSKKKSEHNLQRPPLLAFNNARSL
jgi:hypothetical protein